MTGAIRFGTDGWRGVVGEDFTFANVRLCAEGVARFYRDRRNSGAVVVGYDTRFQSAAFARSAAEVIVAHGFEALLSRESVPTPVICYNVVHRGAVGGVAITASHNSAEWNGFKCRSALGSSEPDEHVAAIERHLDLMPDAEAVGTLHPGGVVRHGGISEEDFKGPYLRHVGSLVDLEALRAAKLHVVVDAMHGAGGGYLPTLLRGGGMQVTEIRGAPNPAFPGMHNPEPIARNLGPLAQAVKNAGADVGVAFDGDADRLGVVDDSGVYLTSIQVGPLLAYLLLEHQKRRGLLVKSLTASSMFWRLGERYGVPVRETKVGFKYIAPELNATPGWLMGAEESGGYAFQGHVPERDGLMSALLFLELMAREGKRPSELVRRLFSLVGPHHYDRLDLAFPADRRAAILDRAARAEPSNLAGMSVERRDALDGVRFTLAGGAWLVIRFSGTEPLLRIYAEAESPGRVRDLLQAGRELTGL